MGRSGHASQQSRRCGQPLNNAGSSQQRHLVRGDREARQFKNGNAQIACAGLFAGCSTDGGDCSCDQEQLLHDDTLLDRDILTTNSKLTLVRCVVAAYERVHSSPTAKICNSNSVVVSCHARNAASGRNFSNISFFNRLRFGEMPNDLPGDQQKALRQLFLSSVRSGISRDDLASIRRDCINMRR
jgi:hypothetical protein